MDMYTELILGAKLKSNTPTSIINQLKNMINADFNNTMRDIEMNLNIVGYQ